MPDAKLYGTLTSPYVRRVRIVAHELGVPLELCDTTQAAHQAALRRCNPLWKVPALVLGEEVLFDSQLINRTLLRRFASSATHLAPNDPDDLRSNSVLLAIDGALDALINAFYLSREGVDPTQVPYLQKQKGRAAAVLSWLAERLEGPHLTVQRGFGLPEIALLTALDWMQFRNVVPCPLPPALLAFTDYHSGRESVRATRPPLE